MLTHHSTLEPHLAKAIWSGTRVCSSTVEPQFSKLMVQVRFLLHAQTAELQVSRDMAESLCQQGEGTVGSNQPSGRLNGRYTDKR